jgi:EAL domain-containing protein (putative c-di-GMP-specific phosphodiesterase class I)
VELLELEITESMVIQSAEPARNMLKMLRQTGICLAVDDFGLGYSSLSYLKQYPFSKLKMDREFVKNVVTSANDKAIAAAIVAMGATLGLEVVAEGIEGQEQLEALRDLGCPAGQGFYLTAPQNAEETGRFLARTMGENSRVVKAFRA